MLEITKGEWRDASIASKIEGETLISVGGKGIIYALYDKNQDDNAKLIIDAGNCYQQCGKLPSELLQERNELLPFLDMALDAMFVELSQLQFDETHGTYREADKYLEKLRQFENLLTKLKAE